MKLSAEDRRELERALIDVAVGREYVDTEMSRTDESGQRTVVKETKTRPDKQLLLQLLNDDPYGIGGPQDYC